MSGRIMVFGGLALVALGAILFVVLKPMVIRMGNFFKERAPLVKKYWKLVVPLLVLTAVAYVVVYRYAYSDVNINIVGQVSGLMLGVIAGYIAFAELGESRFSKLEESGMKEFRARRFNSAKIKLEEAHAIKPKELNLLANLLELYIILELYDRFDNKVSHFRRNIIEEYQEVRLLYLTALKELTKDRPKEAKEKIKDIVQYIALHPHARDGVNWGNGELKQSDLYKSLSAETKKLGDNLLAYVNGTLGDEDDQKFTTGDYNLT